MSETPKIDYAAALNLIWQRQFDFNQLIAYAANLEAVGLNGLVIVLYQTWLQRNKSPYAPFAQFNLGVLLFSENEVDAAGAAYERALADAPSLLQARFNLGLVRERQGRLEEAVEQWRQVSAAANLDDPEERNILIAAYNNFGRVKEGRKLYSEACTAYERSLGLDPTQSDVLHHWVFARARQCLWPVYDPPPGVDHELMRQSTSVLALISLTDDPVTQLATARAYAARKIPVLPPPLAPATGYKHDKIRIGYCSSDFCTHPVAMLTVELFELHDRDKFEVYGFCWSPDDGSPLRQRVVKAFDHYVSIKELDEAASARLIREHEIDILIDLHGQTSGARMSIFAHRPAPIQITYLGLPATTGMPGIDYVIADRFLIPEAEAVHYSEKPLYLPDVYQASDRQRCAAPSPTRKSCGLPARGFIFASFNNNYKYTPDMFTTWMNILRRVPNSVLWLLADNPWAPINLRREAAARGIDPKRLVFAERATPENYLARYPLVDLFLDTFPFNAGTTANDALWMGTPLLTLSGRAFASRMAGALLTAAGMPEMITYNLQDYEEKAVELAQKRSACRQLCERLEKVRQNGVLFDMPKLVCNLEQELIALWHQKQG